MGSTKGVLALIPARGGSKGVPGKNILSIGGKPLIAWTIEAAKASGVCDRIIVSTDDPAISAIAKEYGAEVPFLRPKELAHDDTPDYPVFEHAVRWLKENEGWEPDIVLWLRPTSPLRTTEDICAVKELLVSSGADAVRSVCSVAHHPYWMKQMDDDGHLTPLIAKHDEHAFPRRQMCPPVYVLSGLIDAARVSSALKNGALFAGDVRGYTTPAERGLELDSPSDIRPLSAALGAHDATVEIASLQITDAAELSALILGDSKEYREHFTPFAFTPEELRTRIGAARKDRYWAMRVGGAIAGLFMLRGFDEGYERPAFGVYVGERFAGAGLASLALQYAVSWSKLHAVPAMLLKVHHRRCLPRTRRAQA